MTIGSFVASYSRAGQYRATVFQAGQADPPATVLIIVNRGIPWILIAAGILGAAVLVWVVWVLKPTPSIPGPPHQAEPDAPHVVPTPTFHLHPTDVLRFNPSRGNGIRLEVHYVHNLASLRFTPRVRINKESS